MSISLKDATHRVHAVFRDESPVTFSAGKKKVIFSVHTLKEPQIVIGFVLLVLSKHAGNVRCAIITILKLV